MGQRSKEKGSRVNGNSRSPREGQWPRPGGGERAGSERDKVNVGRGSAPRPVPACILGFASLRACLLLEGPLGSCLAWPPRPAPLPTSFRPPRTSMGAGLWPGGWPPRAWKGSFLPAQGRGTHCLFSLCPRRSLSVGYQLSAALTATPTPGFPTLPLPSPAPDPGGSSLGQARGGPCGALLPGWGHRLQGLFHHRPGLPRDPRGGVKCRELSGAQFGAGGGPQGCPWDS